MQFAFCFLQSGTAATSACTSISTREEQWQKSKTHVFSAPASIMANTLTVLKNVPFQPKKNSNTVKTRKQPALEFNPHSNVIRNFWEKKKKEIRTRM